MSVRLSVCSTLVAKVEQTRYKSVYILKPTHQGHDLTRPALVSARVYESRILVLIIFVYRRSFPVNWTRVSRGALGPPPRVRPHSIDSSLASSFIFNTGFLMEMSRCSLYSGSDTSEMFRGLTCSLACSPKLSVAYTVNLCNFHPNVNLCIAWCGRLLSLPATSTHGNCKALF